jgi:DNA-directed RNA polymerase specialized sigma24 family protein
LYLPDEELLMNYLSTKDEELFNILYKRMHKRLYALAMRILKSPGDAEDVTQDVFLKLCDYGPGIISIAAISTMLCLRMQSIIDRFPAI